MNEDEEYLLQLIRASQHPEQTMNKVLQRATILLQQLPQNEREVRYERR